MSDKEAKLAAARKRAEALKAKKAAEKADDPASTEDKSVTSTQNEAATAENEASTELTNKDTNDDFQKEIERLQNLLEESNAQQETLRSELKDAESKANEKEKSLSFRLKDMEDSLSRRDDQVHSMELELSKLRKERETTANSLKEFESRTQALEIEKAELSKAKVDQGALDALKKELDESQQGQKSTTDELHLLTSELSEARSESEALRNRIQDLETKQSSATGEHQSRAQELQNKTSVLQTENESLLFQLSELRQHLISTQDEKFALAETIERLQKDLKEARASKSSYKSSFETSRTRAPRDFDRSETLQEISLAPEEKASRVSREPPAELTSNMQIDLTAWYDKHAGEVIEV